MNHIRALIVTGVTFVVLAVSGYFAYNNSDLLFGQQPTTEMQPAPVEPVPEVVAITEAASAASAPAPALS